MLTFDSPFVMLKVQSHQKKTPGWGACCVRESCFILRQFFFLTTEKWIGMCMGFGSYVPRHTVAEEVFFLYFKSIFFFVPDARETVLHPPKIL